MPAEAPTWREIIEEEKNNNMQFEVIIMWPTEKL
jgi:hypothetical protein